MNCWQVCNQIKFKLQTVVWPDSPGGVVFGSVHVTQGPGEEAAQDLRFPLALIRVLDGAADTQAPGLKDQRFEITLTVANAGDQLGEFALIGGQRMSQGRSGGRGLLEVEEALYTALNYTDRTVGFELYEVSSSAAEATLVEGRGYMATRAYVFGAKLGTARSYGTPNASNKLTSVVATGTAALSWAAAEERFDSHPVYATPVLPARGGFVLVRKAGSSAPATVSDGTAVALASAFAVGVANSPAAGTYTYGLFQKFDEYADGSTSVRYSTTPASVTVTV